MILDAMFAEIRSVADGWEKEAAQRRRFSKVDPVADTLEHNGGELKSVLDRIESDTYYLTVEDFAKLHDVTPATVRAWIKRGELQTIDGARGPRIKRDARRQKGA